MQCLTCVHLCRPNICGQTGEIIKLMDVHECRDWQLTPMEMMRQRLAPGMKFDAKNIVRLT